MEKNKESSHNGIFEVLKSLVPGLLTIALDGFFSTIQKQIDLALSNAENRFKQMVIDIMLNALINLLFFISLILILISSMFFLNDILNVPRSAVFLIGAITALIIGLILKFINKPKGVYNG